MDLGYRQRLGHDRPCPQSTHGQPRPGSIATSDSHAGNTSRRLGRYRRSSSASAMDQSRNVGCLGCALQSFKRSELISVWTLFGLTMLSAAFSALNDPAWAATVSTTVPRRALTQALILNSIGFNVARSIGPAIGGLIVAVLGAAAAFAANAASFAIVAIFNRRLFGLAANATYPRCAARVDGTRRSRRTRYAMAEPVVRVASYAPVHSISSPAPFGRCFLCMCATFWPYDRQVMG